MTDKPRIRMTTDGRVRVNDGFVNVAAQLGTARDKSSGSSYVYVPMHSLILLNAYRSSWLAKKIVNIPAHDATRRWRTWQAKENIVTAIEKAEKSLGLPRKVKAAQVAARLYGGAALYLSVAGQDPAEPLDLNRVGKGNLLGVDLFTRYQLTPDTMETNAASPNWGLPRHFNIVGLGDQQVAKIHPSRLAIFQGEHVPTTANLEWTWGDSILQSVLDTLRQHDGLVANAASLVFEANVDVLHIPRLMELMSQPGGDEQVLQYLGTLARVKGNNGMLVLDGGDTSLPEANSGGTKFDRKSITFAGLADLWDRFMQVCSAAADIPVTRLFGRSAAGMNATGEGDQDNYDQTVASIQHNDIGPNIDMLDECLLRSALGSRDDKIYYEWRGLSDPTDKERADHAKVVADTLKVISDMGVLPVETLQAATVSALTETGALPGLEAAVDEHGLDLEDPLEDEDLLTGALGGSANTNASPAAGPARKPRLVVDAAPTPLYVSRAVVNAAEIKRWARSQGFTEILDDLHVTIAYSRTPIDWMSVRDNWEEEVTIGAGGPRVLEQFGTAESVAVLRFNSRSLQWRHEEIKEAGASWDHPEYAPHISLAKGPIPEGAQPYTGRIILGPEIFEELDDDR